MENTSGNMAPPGAYESLEAREAQPTTTTTTTTTAAGAAASTASEASSAAAPSHGDIDMHDDDAGHFPARANASMDQEEKGEEREDDGESTVVVNLKFLHRDRVTLQCAPTILIADLKQLVRDANIQAIQQDEGDQQQREPEPATQPLRLIYKGKVLKDDQTLASFNFVTEDTVHAIFSRPAAAPAADASSEGIASDSPHSGADRPTAAGTQPDLRHNTAEFVFETDTAGSFSDISQIIRSVVNSAMNGPPDTESTTMIRIYPISPRGDRPGESSGPVSASSTTTTTRSTAPQATTTPTPSSASQPTPAQSQRGSSVAPTSDLGLVAPVVAPTQPPQPVSVPSPARADSTTLLNQAAALRRSIPALELAPLSRPSELSEEMYNLGNAMRESGDTYLAIHRQLQFLASRFHQENHLNDSERARLTSRVQQLIPVMAHVSQLSTSVSQQLATSPYGQISNASEQAAVAASRAPQQAAQAAPLNVATATPQPPFAQAFQNLFTEILGSTGVNQAAQTGTPVDQALSGLPSFLTNLVAMTAPQTDASAPRNDGLRTGPAGAPLQARGPTPTSTPPPQSGLFQSFAPTLVELLNANPDLGNANLDEFLCVALSAIDRHVVTSYYAAGSDSFVQRGVAEVENALRLYDEAHQRTYGVQESRRSIIRLAMQELSQLSLPIASSLQARSAEVQSWMRRSCSHLFAELCEVAPATTAAQMTGLVVMQLLSGNDQAFLHDRSPFLDRVATEVFEWLRRRFQNDAWPAGTRRRSKHLRNRVPFPDSLRMASSSSLLDALRRDAIASFERATQPSPSAPRRVVAAVDSALHVVLEVLAFGAGGKQLYDSLHITRLVSVDTAAMDALAVRRQVGLHGLTQWPDHTIAFILPPSQAAGQLLARVLAPFLAAAAPIQCAVLWQPAPSPECSLEMERQGLAGVVDQRPLALGLLPVDRNVASLCHDHVFAELYVHGQHHSLTRVVQSILAMEKRRVDHVTFFGPFASRVKTMLDLAQSLEPLPAGPGRFERLILMDRMEDPLSMLLTPMTYEGLLDALIGMNHGVVSFEKGDESDARTKILFNHLDDLFDEIRDVNINTLISHRMAELTEQIASDVRGGQRSVQASATAATIAQLRAQLQNVPQLVQKKQSLANHLTLVEQIQQRSQHVGLRTCVETEMAILNGTLKRGLRVGSVSAGKDVDRQLEEILLRDEPRLLDVYDVLKLLCLLSLVSGGLKDERLQWFRTQLCHSYGYHILPLLVQLEKLELLSTKNKFDYQRRRKELALVRDVLMDEGDNESAPPSSSSTPNDIHFMFPYTGYAPMSVRLVQTSLGIKVKPMNDLFSVGSTASLHSAGSNTQVTSETPRRHVLVYYLGGVTVAELAAYRYLNATQSEFEFFIATTAICNGSRLLRAV